MYIESLLKRPSVRLSDVMQDKSLLEGKDCLIVDSFGLLSFHLSVWDDLL